jgi:hypothetical protein
LTVFPENIVVEHGGNGVRWQQCVTWDDFDKRKKKFGFHGALFPMTLRMFGYQT